MERKTYLFENENNLGQIPFTPKFDQATDRYYRVVTEGQLADVELWRLLERQYDIKWDGVDGGWRGEYWGKLMRGACMVYAYTQDEKLYKILTDSVKNMLAKADGLGRIASYPVTREFIGWDMWARKYVMLGLEYYYDICADKKLKKKIVKALQGQADYILTKVGDKEGQISVFATSYIWGSMNSMSLIQPYAKLYKLTKAQRYLDFIRVLMKTQPAENFNLFDVAKENKKAPFEYPVVKAYEMISCFEGLLDLYEEVGGEDKLQTCVNFADKILETDFTIIGGIGCEDEMFDNATKKQVVHTDINKQETCVTVTLMKFLTALYLKTGDKKYVDAVERSFFNAYLGALNDTDAIGNLVRPLFYSYSPVYNNPRWTLIGGQRSISNYALFGCCIAIGTAGLGALKSLSAFGGNDNVKINFYLSGKYSLRTADGEIEYQISSNYPSGGDITVKFIKATKGLTLSLRMPDWSDEVTIQKQGKTLDYKITDGYINVFGDINAGDELKVGFDDMIKAHPSEKVNGEVNDLYAFSKGASLLCADGKEVDLTKSHPVEIIDGKVKEFTAVNGKYTLGDMVMWDYRETGKDYYQPHDVSVWIKK